MMWGCGWSIFYKRFCVDEKLTPQFLFNYQVLYDNNKKQKVGYDEEAHSLSTLPKKKQD